MERLHTSCRPNVRHTANVKVTPSFMCIREPICDMYTQTVSFSGIEVFDTCGMRDVAMRDVYFAVKSALEPRGRLPLLGK